jgi:hypothetical protein
MVNVQKCVHPPGVPLIFDHPSQPPGGFTFKDPSGVTLKSDTLRALPAKVASYRAANGLPAGNPAAEIEADYKVRHPWLVSKVGVTPAILEDPVAKWLNRQWRTPTKERDFAESTVTTARLTTCAGCQYYTAHKLDPEPSRRMRILGCGRLTDESACTVHHWIVGLAALQAKPETDYAPEGCWVNGIVP